MSDMELSKASPDGQHDVAWLLERLLENVPGSRSALLLSADGMRTADCGIECDLSDKLSAIAAATLSLARGTSKALGDGGGVRQAAFVLNDVSVFIHAPAEGSVLAVVAGQDTDPGVLGYEMDQLGKSVQRFLETPVRAHPATPVPAGHAGHLPARADGTGK